MISERAKVECALLNWRWRHLAQNGALWHDLAEIGSNPGISTPCDNELPLKNELSAKVQ